MPEISDVIRMSPELKAGIRHARRLALTGERDEMKLTTMERSLELAMGAVSALWDSFDGDELRDALVRLVSVLERECREKALLAVDLLEVIGIPAEDDVAKALTARALR